MKIEKIEPELRSLVLSLISAEEKIKGSYNSSGTRWQRYNTPQQDAAVTRASNRLYNKYIELHPEDKMRLGHIELMKIVQDIHNAREEAIDSI